MSTLRRTPTALLVYSTLAAYGSRRGGALPGRFFVDALGPLGQPATAVRKALVRMERDGELRAARHGRAKLYRLAPFGKASVDAGTEKLFAPPPRAWDRRFSICCYRFDDGRRAERERVRDLLEVEGFAQLAPGVWIHVRDKTRRLREALRACRGGLVTVFRADRVDAAGDAETIARLWDLPALARRYARFTARFRGLPRRLAPNDAFAARFALVIEYLRIAWDDPELPPDLLPRAWPGAAARALARHLYEAWLPATLAHGDAVLARTKRKP